MFAKKPSTNQDGVTKAIDNLLAEMADLNGDDPEYARMNEQLTKLYSHKEIGHKVDSHKRVSAETLTLVTANLVGIAMIVGHERANVLTSKALSMLTKLR